MSAAIFAAAFSPDGKTLLTGSHDGTARLWVVPTPVEGDVERIDLWVQVTTGQAWDPEHGVIHVLDARSWHQRRQRLCFLPQAEAIRLRKR